MLLYFSCLGREQPRPNISWHGCLRLLQAASIVFLTCTSYVSAQTAKTQLRALIVRLIDDPVFSEEFVRWHSYRTDVLRALKQVHLDTVIVEQNYDQVRAICGGDTMVFEFVEAPETRAPLLHKVSSTFTFKDNGLAKAFADSVGLLALERYEKVAALRSVMPRYRKPWTGVYTDPEGPVIGRVYTTVRVKPDLFCQTGIYEQLLVEYSEANVNNSVTITRRINCR